LYPYTAANTFFTIGMFPECAIHHQQFQLVARGWNLLVNNYFCFCLVFTKRLFVSSCRWLLWICYLNLVHFLQCFLYYDAFYSFLKR
jgi:hypothetical protein